MEKFLMFLIVLSLASPLHAQFTLGRSPQPATPQAAEMTHYGDHGVNLYTGRVTVSIPIGEYKDKDFTVPVSLEYNYNGMRPNEQAAEPGLGWMLSCGGMITREVVGAADEGEWTQRGGRGHLRYTLIPVKRYMLTSNPSTTFLSVRWLQVESFADNC